MQIEAKICIGEKLYWQIKPTTAEMGIEGKIAEFWENL